MPTSLPRGEHTRPLAVGDKMVYDFRLEAVDPKGQSLGGVQGTLTAEVQKGYKHGPVPKKISKTYHISERLDMKGGSTAQIEWAGQASDGTLYFLGKLDEGKEWVLAKDSGLRTNIPAVLSEGSSWKSTLRLSNGKTETETCKVVGIEKVETPAGEFEAYKTKVESRASDGRRLSGYQWLRPEFPRPIKVRLDSWNTNTAKKGKQHIEEELESYKFAKQKRYRAI